MDKLVSIIIPVYNTEKYLAECIDPIISIKDINLEILLINDGSLDKSGEICDSYSQKDSRIRVFHQENKGVSVARNVGIDNSKGDYLYFMDSDDFINIDEFITACKYTIKHNIGMFVAGYRNYDTDNKDFKLYVNNFKGEMSSEDALVKMMHGEMFTCIGGFFAKKDIVKDVYFTPEYKYGEDTEFINKCILLNEKIYVSNTYLRYYRQIPTSAMHRTNLRRYDNYFARKSFKYFVENREQKYTELIDTINNFNIPEVLEDNLRLMCRDHIPYMKLRKFLKETGIQNEMDKAANDENVEKQIRDSLLLWKKNSLLFYIGIRIETWKYFIRSRLGRLKRKLIK